MSDLEKVEKPKKAPPRRRIKCPHCEETFYWTPYNTSTKAGPIVDPNLSAKEKRVVYMKRWVEKREKEFKDKGS